MGSRTAPKKAARKRRVVGTIDQLPAALRDQIHSLLQQGWRQSDITKAINAELKSAGERPISRHALNRYTKRVEQNGQRIREAREAAAAWSKTVGDLPVGDVGAYLVELVQCLAFDNLNSMAADEDNAIDLKQLANLALAIKRIEEANSEADKRIERARRTAASEVSEKLKSEGLSQKTIDDVRKHIMGIA